jgi:hypothetical protein
MFCGRMFYRRGRFVYMDVLKAGRFVGEDVVGRMFCGWMF